MNTMKNKIALGLLIALALSASAFGQAAFTTTTLSSAVGPTTNNVVVASATGVTAPGLPTSAGGIGSPSGNAVTVLYVDREEMRVNGVSGTTINVERGYEGTRQTPHFSGAKVWVGPGTASYFTKVPPYGSCVAANLTVLPRIDTATGNIWTCAGQSATTQVWQTLGDFTGQLGIGAVIASATTIAPIAAIHHVSGTTDVVTITVPAACQPLSCTIVLIPDAIWHTTNAGNIAIASTAVVSKALTLIYDPVAVKWLPSY